MGLEPGGFGALDHLLHAGYLTDDRADLDAAEVVALLGLGRPARVLDAGCGDGRIAVRLAACGHDVVAVDRDPDQLARAAMAAAARGVALELLEVDLRELSLDPPADAALLWFTTFGFLDDGGNLSVLKSLAGCLEPGAPLLVDSLDPAAVRRSLLEDPGPVVVEAGGLVQVDERRFDEARGRLEVQRRQEGPEGIVERQLSLRLPSPAEWRAMLGSAGFELRAIERDEDDDWALRVLALKC